MASLGTGNTIPLNYPTQISDADGNPLGRVIDISDGQEHAFMHFIDGSVLACGQKLPVSWGTVLLFAQQTYFN